MFQCMRYLQFNKFDSWNNKDVFFFVKGIGIEFGIEK